MLARPEPGSRAHILLWLAGKNPAETYCWDLHQTCACGQYAREALGKSNIYWTTLATMTPEGAALAELNAMAMTAKSFGELYARALAAWATP